MIRAVVSARLAGLEMMRSGATSSFAEVFSHPRRIALAAFVQRSFPVRQCRIIPARLGVTDEVEPAHGGSK